MLCRTGRDIQWLRPAPGLTGGHDEVVAHPVSGRSPAIVSGRGYGGVMADFSAADLRGARFDRADLTGAQFFASDLTGARLRGVDLTRVSMRGVELVDVDIDGEIMNVTINGVDVGPLIEAELDRRDPDRVKMRPEDPAGFREAWEILRRRWDQTVARGRAGCRPSGCPGPSTASGRSSRRSATWSSPPTPGSGGRSAATRLRGTR